MAPMAFSILCTDKGMPMIYTGFDPALRLIDEAQQLIGRLMQLCDERNEHLRHTAVGRQALTTQWKLVAFLEERGKPATNRDAPRQTDQAPEPVAAVGAGVVVDLGDGKQDAAQTDSV